MATRPNVSVSGLRGVERRVTHLLLVDAQPGAVTIAATRIPIAQRVDAPKRGPRLTEFPWLADAMTNADPWASLHDVPRSGQSPGRRRPRWGCGEYENRRQNVKFGLGLPSS